MDASPRQALAPGGALVVKSAARAALVLVGYAVLGAAFHWAAFGIAAADIWGNFHSGPGGAHAGGAAIVFVLVILLFTPPGLVTLFYLLGLPFLCLLLGKREAVHAAVNRALREKKAALSGLLVDVAMRAAETAGAVPGAARGGAALRRLQGAATAMHGSRMSRFVLRAVVGAVHLDRLVAATDFVERAKTDPDGARAALALAVDPALDDIGQPPSSRPLLLVFAFTTALTATRGLWCRFL